MADQSATQPGGATPAPHEAAPGGADPWPSRDAFETPAIGSWTYRLMIRWGWLLMRTHFRIEIRGEAFPTSGPVVISQNHSNGLGDAHFPMSSTRRPLQVLVKYSLLKMPLVGYVLRNINAIPMYRKKDGVDTRQNASSFEAIDKALLDGAVIAIFPEGESLNSHRLRPLKSGMARMLVSAYEASDSTIKPIIVPVGVTYEDRDRFRSLASAVIGEPFEVVPIIERAGSEFRVAIRAIMKESRARMEKLTIQADSEEEWSAAVALERILPRSSAPIGMRQMAALEALRQDTGEDAERRREAIARLGDSLRRARLSGDEILSPKPSLLGVVLPLLALSPLLLLSLAVWGLPILISERASLRAPTPDKLVTVRLLGNFVLVPAFAVITAAVLAVVVTPLAGGAWLLAALLSVATFTWSYDLAVAAIVRWRRRAIARSSGGTESIQGALRSIREAFVAGR